MEYRSWLMVPGTQIGSMTAAAGIAADVIVVDLYEAVASSDKPGARLHAAEWLRVSGASVIEQRPVGRWVRINPLESGLARDDLNAIMPGAPDGVLLPCAEGPEAVRQLAAEIYELEHRHGLTPASTRILPVVGETARAAATVTDYLESGHQRLAGLTWGANGLAAELGMHGAHDTDGGWNEVLRHVRAQTLLTAHGCGIMAIEALSTDALDHEAVLMAAQKARGDGFAGMLVGDPSQVAAVNAAFSPQAVEPVREMIESFAASYDIDALSRRSRPADLSALTSAYPARRRAERMQPEDLRSAVILRPA